MTAKRLEVALVTRTSRHCLDLLNIWQPLEAGNTPMKAMVQLLPPSPEKRGNHQRGRRTDRTAVKAKTAKLRLRLGNGQQTDREVRGDETMNVKGSTTKISNEDYEVPRAKISRRASCLHLGEPILRPLMLWSMHMGAFGLHWRGKCGLDVL